MSAAASNRSWLASLTTAQRAALLADLTDRELAALEYDWPRWARPDQIPPPGDWRVWLLQAGRGAGKTRSGAEAVRRLVESGQAMRVALVAPTAADARKVIVEGESGLLSVSPPWFRPQWLPGIRELRWPNGAIATTYSAEEPERLRGPQHDFAWCDELAAWSYPDTWDMLMFGLRLGADPRCVVTTTPKPGALLRRLLSDPTVAVTRATTYDNRANLAPAFLDQIIRRYEGTRLGRQELLAEFLDDVPGALWTRETIERARIGRGRHPDLARIVVAIDPAMTSGEEADETGLIVAGRDQRGHGYVLADQSGRYAPAEWARRAVALYREHKADRIVAEVNAGGEMVEATVRMVAPEVAYRAVRASRGKVVRAEPVAALYEQGRIHHAGAYPDLEDQMCAFTTDFDRGAAGYSPDRVDALVWALSDLLVEPMPSAGIYDLYRARAEEARKAAETAKAQDGHDPAAMPSGQ